MRLGGRDFTAGPRSLTTLMKSIDSSRHDGR
jgi:hypothetical protein